MLNVLHVSDTHLGYRQYHSEQRRKDFSDAFDESIGIAIEENVDAVLHTGDLFHSKNPNLKTRIEAIRIIKKLENENIPFLAIVGNHERKRDEQFLDEFNMALDNIVKLGEESPWVKGNVAIHGFDFIPPTQWNTTDLSLEDVGADVNIVCMHQLVDPPVPELFNPHKADNMVERFGIDVDAVALGDYHERGGNYIDGTYFYYPGSTEMTSKDEPHQKYVSLLQLNGDESFVEFDRKIETRQFVTVNVHLNEEDGAADQIRTNLELYDLKDTVVHLNVSGADVPISVSKMKELIDNCGALVSRVNDERSYNQEIEAIDYEAKDIESTIDDELSENGISEIGYKIDDIVRDTESVKKSHVRSEVKELMEEESP